jgi:hypothetical protein
MTVEDFQKKTGGKTPLWNIDIVDGIKRSLLDSI